MPHKEALAKARELARTGRSTPRRDLAYPHQFSGGQRQRIAIARALGRSIPTYWSRTRRCIGARRRRLQAQVLELLDEIQTRLGIALLFITP